MGHGWRSIRGLEWLGSVLRDATFQGEGKSRNRLPPGAILRSMTSTTSPLPSTPPELSPWRSHTFRNVWIANLGSHFGLMIQAVAAAWVMTQLGGSTQMVALIQTASTLPIVLFSLWTGALADGYARRLILIVAQSFMLIASAMLAIYAALGLLTPWLLLSRPAGTARPPSSFQGGGWGKWPAAPAAGWKRNGAAVRSAAACGNASPPWRRNGNSGRSAAVRLPNGWRSWRPRASP